VHSRWRFIPGLDQFGALLCLLLLSFLLAGLSGLAWPTLVGALANIAAVVAGFSATGLRDDRVRTGIFMSLAVIGFVLIGIFESTSIGGGIGASLQALALGAILGALVRRVLQHDSVTIATLMGVISAYVLIGLIFAWVYYALIGFRPAPVLDPPDTDLPVYFSFVVLSTLGFGDISPVDELAQRITALEAITGQIFLATVVARFVSMYGQDRPRGSR